jgi:hypothetical protein
MSNRKWLHNNKQLNPTNARGISTSHRRKACNDIKGNDWEESHVLKIADGANKVACLAGLGFSSSFVMLLYKYAL